MGEGILPFSFSLLQPPFSFLHALAPCSLPHALCSMLSAPCSLLPSPCSLLSAPCPLLHALCPLHSAPCPLPPATHTAAPPQGSSLPLSNSANLLSIRQFPMPVIRQRQKSTSSVRFCKQSFRANCAWHTRQWVWQLQKRWLPISQSRG